MGTKRFRVAISAAVAVCALLAVTSPAHALSKILCRVAATASQSEIAPGPPATYQWNIVMTGECSGDNKGPYAVFGSADGTSTGLGLCDGSGVIQNLSLDAVMFLDSTKGPQFSKVLTEHWAAPVTTYPVLTPFVVQNPTGKKPIGAGVLSQHVSGNCDGPPSTAIISLRVTL